MRARSKIGFLGFVLGCAAVLASAVVTPGLARESDDDRSRPGSYETNRAANLYERPSSASQVLRRLKAQTQINVVEVTEQWYRVRASQEGNPDGWIRRSYADPAGTRREIRDSAESSGGERVRFRAGIFRLVSPTYVRKAPDVESGKIATLREGQEVKVVGKTGSWYRIESEDGDRPPGYIPTISVERLGDAGPKR